MISVFHCEDNLIEKRVSPLDLQCKYRVTTMFIIIKYNKQFNRMKAQKIHRKIEPLPQSSYPSLYIPALSNLWCHRGNTLPVRKDQRYVFT